MKEITYTVKENVSIERQIDLVGLTIEESFIDGIVNPMLKEILFKVNIFLVFTENNLTAEDKQNKFAIYEQLRKQGIIKKEQYGMDDLGSEIMTIISNEEYWDLKRYLNLWTNEYQAQKNSVQGILDSVRIFATDIADKMGVSFDKLKEIDLPSLAEIIPVAKELGFDLEKKDVN